MKRTKNRRDIKSKLIAAICMLMVSVIMMASTSYAWFTLSTAPEVKGIQTAVGANGNLEMALLGTQGSYDTPANISSAVGDSSAAQGKSPITANYTWGNLIDLSHESYGLSLITLKPAQFIVAENNTITGEQILAVPMYGADGRVTTVTAENTIMATYDAAKRAFTKVDTTGMTAEQIAAIKHYGVRAVGGSTNRSIREMAFDTYMSQGAMSASLAKTAAANSLNAYGAVLANMGIKGASEPDATFTAADVDQLIAMVNGILGYNTYNDKNEVTGHTKGITEHIQDSLTAYSIAVLASSLNTTSYTAESTYKTFEDHMKALASADAATVASAVAEFAPEALKTAATELAAVIGIANSAMTQLNNLKGTNPTWAQLSPIVATLFDSQKMTFCGMTLEQVKAPAVNGDPTTAGTAILQDKMQKEYNNQLVAEMTGGIYSEIADLTDTFSGSAFLTVQGLSVKAVLQANKTSTARYWLGQANAALATAGAPEDDASAVSSISDAYAYVIDMAFRTNASGSKLLLQTAAEQRIDTSTDETTMGGGSSMTFTSVDGFSTENMKELMNNIKVVFFLNDGTAKQVLVTAKLDTANATVSGNDVTAGLKIVKTDGSFASQADAVIYNMPTNQPVKISALVYLDGETITNGDVGTGALSMSGRMNLQFSSSANLVPMDYSAGYAPANPVPEATAGAGVPETTGAAVNP